MNSIKINPSQYLFGIRILIFTILFISMNVFAGGRIAGVVKDKVTLEPLVGANVIILNTYYGAATDINGYFEIRNIPAGTYSVRFAFIGYISKIKSDIKINDSKTVFENFNLEEDKSLNIWSKVIIRDSASNWTLDEMPVRGLSQHSLLKEFKDKLEKKNIVYPDAQQNNCPPQYTYSVKLEPEVNITEITVKDSSRYSIQPGFIRDINTVSQSITIPDIIRFAGFEVTGIYQLGIDKAGEVINCSIINSMTMFLDTAVINVLYKERFTPAIIQDKTTNSEIFIKIHCGMNTLMDEPGYKLSEIKYEMESYPGSSYKVIFFKDNGQVLLMDYKEDKHMLKQIGKITLNTYRQLSDFIISQNFFKYKDDYTNSKLFDIPIDIITIKADDKVKAVTSTDWGYKPAGHGPIGCWAVKNLLLQSIENVKWEEVEE
jgi:CarboxypepD_reg-like domain